MRARTVISVAAVMAFGLSVFYLTQNLNRDNLGYFLSRRIPRLTAMILTGSAAGISALAVQAVSRNRILTPAVMGIDALYILIQTVVVLIGGVWMASRPGINALVAVTLLWIFSAIIWFAIRPENTDGVTILVLTGLVAGTLFRSASGFLQMIADPDRFTILQGFLYASFTRIDSRIVSVSIPLAVLAAFTVLREWHYLDVLWLGEETAGSLGVDVPGVNRRIFIGACGLTAVSTALAGPLTFLGLLLANLSRELVPRHSHRLQLAVAIPAGIIVTVGGQLLVERSTWFRVPLNVVIGIAGGGYLLYLILKGERK